MMAATNQLALSKGCGVEEAVNEETASLKSTTTFSWVVAGAVLLTEKFNRSRSTPVDKLQLIPEQQLALKLACILQRLRLGSIPSTKQDQYIGRLEQRPHLFKRQHLNYDYRCTSERNLGIWMSIKTARLTQK